VSTNITGNPLFSQISGEIRFFDDSTKKKTASADKITGGRIFKMKFLQRMTIYSTQKIFFQRTKKSGKCILTNFFLMIKYRTKTDLVTKFSVTDFIKKRYIWGDFYDENSRLDAEFFFREFSFCGT
jgi:hypothetical protein